MTFTAELKDVEAWSGGDLLPPGNYEVEVTEALEGKSSSDNPQLELELTAISGEHKDGSIRDWIVVIPTTAGKVKQILGAFGVGDNLDGTVKFEASDLMGKRARIVVRNETYDGKERTRVKAYEESKGEAPASSNGKKSDEEDLPF